MVRCAMCLHGEHEHIIIIFCFFSATVCHTLCHCCCRCCWSNFHLANNNGISGAMAMGMVIHISKTCRMSLNHFHITVKRSFSMRSSLSKHLLIYFSVFHFSPSSVYERFCSFFYLFIYFFSYSFGSPSCLLFIFVCRFLWHWLFVECCLCRSDVLTAPRKGQKDERTEKKIRNESYFALASSFHRRDNWHTDSPFPLLPDWQATDIALFTGRKRRDAIMMMKDESMRLPLLHVARTVRRQQRWRCVHILTVWQTDGQTERDGGREREKEGHGVGDERTNERTDNDINKAIQRWITHSRNSTECSRSSNENKSVEWKMKKRKESRYLRFPVPRVYLILLFA